MAPGCVARYHRGVPSLPPDAPPADNGLAPVPARRRSAPRRAEAMTGSDAPPVLVEVHRGNTIESRHRGHVVQVDVSGRVVRAAGTPDVPVLLRSTVKPFALVALVESGAADALALTPAELAVMCASHGGEDKHVRTLQALLRRASVSQTLLRCGTEGAPADTRTAARLARDGETPGVLRHSCSGFHAASLLLSAHAGWPLADYDDPAHPSQVAVRETVARLFGRRTSALRACPDNCGLQTYEVPLVEVARAYLLLADPEGAAPDEPRARSAPALLRIRDAMMTAPDMVGGTYESLDTELMRRRPGELVSKAGADGLRAVGLLAGSGMPRPRESSDAPRQASTDSPRPASALAIKIEDGDLSRRAIKAASVEVLAQIGALEDADLRALAPFHHPTVRTPAGVDAATASPRFELAPLAELA
jgi:L-asparaginase II